MYVNAHTHIPIVEVWCYNTIVVMYIYIYAHAHTPKHAHTRTHKHTHTCAGHSIDK